jgi:ribosome-binding protein aMBF1 (putative translation factor)
MQAKPKPEEGRMKRRFIPAKASFRQWKKDPRYVAEYEALDEDFALASVLIEARSKADMTQEEVAAAMGTTQAVVARLESGKVLPSTRTLERFARSTRSRLRISFESSSEPAALKR